MHNIIFALALPIAAAILAWGWSKTNTTLGQMLASEVEIDRRDLGCALLVLFAIFGLALLA